MGALRCMVLCLLWAVTGCGGGRAQSVQEAGEKGIRDLVAATQQAAARGDMGTYLKFFDAQGAHVLPNRPIDYGVAQRKGGFPPDYSVTMRIEKVGVAESGELGYAFGDYNQTRRDLQTGSLEHTTGKWMTVFKRQANGSWGAIADTYNVDSSLH